jgi:hypothetical protein
VPGTAARPWRRSGSVRSNSAAPPVPAGPRGRARCWASTVRQRDRGCR